MTFEIGDKVRFLNDVGGGVVIGFRDNSIVQVESEDGFVMPMPAGELLLDRQVVANKEGRLEEKSAQTGTTAQKIKRTDLNKFKHIAFSGKVVMAVVPENYQLLHVSNFYLYLLNTSKYDFQYFISSYDGPVATLLKEGTVSAGKKIKVGALSQTEISKIQFFQLQGIYFKEGLFDPQSPVNQKYNVSGYDFYKTSIYYPSKFFSSPVMLFDNEPARMKEAIEKLSKSDVAKVIVEKEQKEEKPQAKPKQKPEIDEVDLHIESIVDDHAEMSNGEIINIQLNRFETALQTAINAKSSKIVFIHGVGNGKLKLELRKKLDRAYPDLKYQDASFKEYGYGATMVYLK